MKLAEKMDKTDARAVHLMQTMMGRLSQTSAADHDAIKSKLVGIKDNTLEDHFRLVLSLLEYDSPNLCLEDRYALAYQALRIHASLCNEIDRETVVDALLEADDLYNSHEQEAALELLNDTAQVYVL